MKHTNSPKIALIVPVFNVENYLHECIDSVLNQTYKNFTLFAVNDGSSDCSGKILDEYSEKDPRIKVFHQENKGVAAARNIALDAIQTDGTYSFIGFIDPDDYVSHNYLETIITHVRKDKIDYIVFGRCDFDKIGTYPRRNKFPHQTFVEVLNEVSVPKQYFTKRRKKKWDNKYNCRIRFS